MRMQTLKANRIRTTHVILISTAFDMVCESGNASATQRWLSVLGFMETAAPYSEDLL